MEQILSRQTIAEAAEAVACEFAKAPAGSPEPANPFPPLSAAAAAWRAAFLRYLLKYSTPAPALEEVEGGA